MSANLVARETGWRMRDWTHGERTTEEAFRPLETFADRFGALLAHVRGLGFDTLDVWTAHLHWRWATDEHLAIARELLDRHGLRVATVAGGFGKTEEDLGRACGVAVAVGAPVLGGMLDARAGEPEVAAVLRGQGLRLGLENHPEDRTVEDMLARIGDGAGGTVGTTVDTGWWATH
ncbi:MAG: sugar phosphate isomerase/epimerase family protein, partial [Gaiellaceae bacterium]